MSDILSSETFLNVYRRKLKESSTREADFNNSSVAEYAVYAERVGFLRGIEEALAIFNETERHFFPRD